MQIVVLSLSPSLLSEILIYFSVFTKTLILVSVTCLVHFENELAIVERSAVDLAKQGYCTICVLCRNNSYLQTL